MQKQQSAPLLYIVAVGVFICAAIAFAISQGLEWPWVAVLTGSIFALAVLGFWGLRISRRKQDMPARNPTRDDAPLR